MSNVQSILKQDPYYIDQRMKEFNNIKTHFARQLAHILMYAPVPARILDLKTGEWTVAELDPKWQSIIDKLTNQFNTMVEKEFPELRREGMGIKNSNYGQRA